jgi:hypothetical protein
MAGLITLSIAKILFPYYLEGELARLIIICVLNPGGKLNTQMQGHLCPQGALECSGLPPPYCLKQPEHKRPKNGRS